MGTCFACQDEGVLVKKISEKDHVGRVRYWHVCTACESRVNEQIEMERNVGAH